MVAAPIFRTLFLAVLVSLLTVAVPGTAAADEQAAVNKVTNLNKRAIDAYNKQDYETARALLKEALELCASAGLDKHAIRARTHIHFGIVAIVGFKQREVGLKQFRKALEVQPDIKLTKTLATPELQDAFEEAVLAGESGGGGGGAATAGGGGEPAGAGEGGGDGPGAVADDDDGAKPTIKRPAPHKKKSDDDDKDEGDGQKGVFFVGLTGGFALGLIKGNGELDPNMHKLDAPGFATGQGVQVTPELGLFISPDLMLSLQARFQYVTGLNGKAGTGCGSDNFCTPGHTAGAVFGKATYLLTNAPFRLTLGGQLGYGYIRHALGFPDPNCKEKADSPTTQSCVDTLAGGPLLVGPTIGFFWELGSSVDLIFAVNTALGVPNFTFNFDIGAGIGFRI